MKANEYEETIPPPIACQRGMSFTGYGKRAALAAKRFFKSAA
jgi:hypothetical protein